VSVAAYRPAGAAAGLLLDRVLGEPPPAVHPVAWFGRAMLAAERADYRDSRAAGVVHAGAGVVLGAVAGAGLGVLRRPCGRVGWVGQLGGVGRVGQLGGVGQVGQAGPLGRVLAGGPELGRSRLAASLPTTVATVVAVAGRALADTAMSVADALRDGDLDEARDLLPALVGRDPSGLDAGEIARAVVESVAENTVDAVVAPALWAAVAGAPGAWGYRAVNTLDAMVGHRSVRYRRFGWASARLDDAAGYLPARATAVLVAAVRPQAAGAVWRAVCTQARAHPSPNAGVAEAAFAAALGVRLGGRNRYGDRTEIRPTLGAGPPPAAADIPAATRLSGDVGLALAAVLAGVGWLRNSRGWLGSVRA
jgi:adenosylcobinamide-phosphate synthase